MGYPMTKPANRVTEQPRKIATIRPPSLASFRKSQRSSMTKIMAYSRLFFSALYAADTSLEWYRPMVQNTMFST